MVSVTRVAPYTGAWIEILPRIGVEWYAKSHPTRVRGLKLMMSCNGQLGLWSHPTRVRGLK